MAEVLGIQYDMALRDLWLEDKSIEIKWSIKKDWLDWYAEILLWLAKWLNLQNVEKKEKTVSIVWNLFDRHEWDCIWNIEELTRILENMGLTVNSIWLDWNSTTELKNIEKSKYIISLPYWRRAAKQISKRTWWILIETCLAFSIKSTEKFILDISNSIWLDNNYITKFIKEEKDYFYKKIVSISSIFFDKKISFISDPNLIEWFINFSEILWFDLWTLVWVSNKTKKDAQINDYNIEYWIEFAKIITEGNDLVMKNSIKDYWDNQLDFGFPNTTNHYFSNYPYLWFKWWLNFVNILYNYFLKMK
jgi:nitrogenase molybdenum-iron protein alpha/beta subunit